MFCRQKNTTIYDALNSRDLVLTVFQRKIQKFFSMFIRQKNTAILDALNSQDLVSLFLNENSEFP